METDDPNPYQTPHHFDEEIRQRPTHPNTFDWIIAIVFGAFTLAVVFPTTCTGSVFLFLGLSEAIGQPFGQLIPLMIFALIIASLIFAIVSAIWVGKRYIGSITTSSTK